MTRLLRRLLVLALVVAAIAYVRERRIRAHEDAFTQVPGAPVAGPVTTTG